MGEGTGVGRCVQGSGLLGDGAVPCTERPGVLLRNGIERAEYGCTTTWENADRQTFTISRVDPPRVALRRIVEIVEPLDPTFRLVAYSTPETIYTDLQGMRLPTLTKGGSQHAEGKYVPMQPPERVILAGIGRKDLLHPRLAALS